MNKRKFKIKTKVYIGLLSFFGISSLVVTTAVACGVNDDKNTMDSGTTNNKYDFVSFDPTLTGNLAVLGFKPTIQSLYNNDTIIPSYVKQLNVPTESGVYPAANNTETWLARNPGIAYNFFDSKYVENYGFKNVITFSNKPSTIASQNFVSENLFNLLSNPNDSQNLQAKNAAIAWDIDAQIKDLADQIDAKIKNKDNSSIFADKDAKVKSIIDKLHNKISKFKVKLNSQLPDMKQPKVSFWGINYGPNLVTEATNFNEYGPSIQFPGWLYSNDSSLTSSLDFLPAVPSNDLKFGLFQNGNFNTLGWKSENGSYNATQVQLSFANSSDYVFVEIPNSLASQINDPLLINKIKTNFAPMVTGTTNDDAKKDKVFLISSGFSLAPFNMLGIDNAINQIAQAILNDNNFSKTVAFDVSNLVTLSSTKYDFVRA